MLNMIMIIEKFILNYKIMDNLFDVKYVKA